MKNAPASVVVEVSPEINDIWTRSLDSVEDRLGSEAGRIQHKRKLWKQETSLTIVLVDRPLALGVLMS